MCVSARFKVRFPSLAPPRHTPRLGNLGGRRRRSKCITFYPTWTYRLGRCTPFPFPSHDLLASRQMSPCPGRGQNAHFPDELDQLQAIRGPAKLADHLTMVREVAAINPCQK